MGDSEKENRSHYLRRTYFEASERPDGSIVYEAKRPSVMQFGPPPWTLETPDVDMIPDDCTDLVGVILWRGVRFVREEPQGEREVDHDEAEAK